MTRGCSTGVSQVVLAVARQQSVHDVLQMIVRSARSLGPTPGTLPSAFPMITGVSPSSWWTGSRKTSGRRSVRCHASTACSGCCCARASRSGWPTSAPTRASRAAGPSAHPELSGFLGVPVKDGGEVLAIIFAANKEVPGAGPGGTGTEFTARDEELLSLFAAHAAIALTNARLSERSRELSVLEERARLARDLHDAVSQKLFSLRARARAAAVLAGRDPARAAAEMEAVAQLGADAHAELRAVIDGLAPPELGEAGLAESLRRYAVLAGRAHGVTVRFCGPPTCPCWRNSRRRRCTGWLRRRCTTRSGTAGPHEVAMSLFAQSAPGHPGGDRRRLRVRPRYSRYSRYPRRPGAGLDAGPGRERQAAP